MTKKIRKIKVCPNCGSPNIYYVSGMITGEVYRCNDCNYVGALILEFNENEYKKFLEEKRAK